MGGSPGSLIRHAPLLIRPPEENSKLVAIGRGEQASDGTVRVQEPFKSVAIFGTKDVIASHNSVDREPGLSQKIASLDYTVDLLALLTGNGYRALGPKNASLRVSHPGASNIEILTKCRRYGTRNRQGQTQNQHD